MRQSALFTKTRREAPKDEVAKNASLLIRAGYIHKDMAGVYSYLPLGRIILNNIIGIIREEMNAIGGQEVFLSALQRPDIWTKTGRWQDDAIDVWFKTKNKEGNELGLAPTHEEPVTELMREHIHSYKDLPQYVYQFQTKFRNELRAKSGIMRSREFIMKDLYSFSRSEVEFREFYERCAESYTKIFARVGIGSRTYRTFASGGSFSKFSDEYQTVCDAGEDSIYIHKEKGIAINKEVCTDDVLQEFGIRREDLEEAKAVEVGNIFPLGTKYASALGLTYQDESGKEEPVYMGCYGIGPGRLMGTIVEIYADEEGIIWPQSVAPFTFHLISIGSEETRSYAAALYDRLTNAGFTVLFDDRDVRAGEKFADADLLGMPYRVVASDKTRASEELEVRARESGEITMMREADLMKLVKGT